MHETVVEDPLLRLIEWHSSGRGADSEWRQVRPSQRDEHAIDSALLEWHLQRTDAH